VTLDAALNLIWLGICVSALGLLARSEFRHRYAGRARLRHLASVVLVALALFPCVSASDDFFCLSLLETHPAQQGGTGSPLPEDSHDKTAANVYLARVLSALDHVRPAAFFSLALALSFIAVVFIRPRIAASHTLLSRTGRAPPSV
jgi:hypothetical protein